MKILSYITLTAILLCMVSSVQAQPGFGDDVSDVPVDGGISLLVAAGIGYGAKKIHAARIKRKP